MLVFRKRTTKENECNKVSKTSNLHRKTKFPCLWTMIKVWFVKTKLIHSKCNCWGDSKLLFSKFHFNNPTSRKLLQNFTMEKKYWTAAENIYCGTISVGWKSNVARAKAHVGDHLPVKRKRRRRCARYTAKKI